MNWFCYSSFDILTTRLFKGDSLPDVLEESEIFKTRIQALGNSPLYFLLTFLRGFILRMRGLSSDFSSLTSQEFDQLQFEQEVLGRIPDLVRCWYYTFLLEACIFSRDFVQAQTLAQKMEKILWSTPGQYTFPEYHFCLALTLTQLFMGSDPEQKTNSLKTLASIHERLRTWAKNCPQNFHHKFALISAEIARIQGRTEDAMRLYEEAILSARQNAFLQHEALSYEIAAKFYDGLGFTSFATLYLSHARSSYRRWGALGKVKQLDQLFPTLDFSESQKDRDSFAFQLEKLDLISIVKASQAISSAIEFEKVIETLFQAILEQSGGQKAILLLKKEKRLKIAAEASVDPFASQLKLSRIELAPRSSTLPQSIINYVSKTGESILLNDARVDTKMFSSDPYFSTLKPRSVLCLPILRSREIIGVVYLENNVTSYAFSKENLTVLELIAAQTAISLQNAKLYETLRLENTKRKLAQLKEKKSRIEAERAIVLRDDFLALASHELRTPLTPLKLYLDILIRKLNQATHGILPDMNALLNGVKGTELELRKMIRLIDDLLEVSLIRAGRLILKKEKLNLVKLVQHSLIGFENEMRESGCTSKLEAPVETFGRWDPFRIEEVVTNLLSNAVKFGPGKPIQIRVWPEQDRAMISVTDHGIGIAKADLSRIFDQFERASSVMNFPGLGIGLFIAQQIALAHGGTIRVRSKLGKRSTFTVELPIDL